MTIQGLAILALEPREFTVVHVVGQLDQAMVGRWQAEALASSGADR